MTTLAPRIIGPAEGRRFSVLGIPHAVLVRGADTAGRLELFELEIPPGLGIPPHVHTREDEAFYVLAGSVEFTVAGRPVVAAPGTTVFGPRDVAHSFRTAGAAARMLVTIFPGGLEPMFAELAALPAGPPDLPRVATIIGRYGISFV